MKKFRIKFFILGLIVGFLHLYLLNIYFGKISKDSGFSYIEHKVSDIDPVDGRGISWLEEKIVYSDKYIQLFNYMIENDILIKLISSFLIYSIVDFVYITKQKESKISILRDIYGNFFIGFGISSLPSIIIIIYLIK